MSRLLLLPPYQPGNVPSQPAKGQFIVATGSGNRVVGATGITYTANANGGATYKFVPQSTTGLNIDAAGWYIDTAQASFTGNIYADQVIAIGYNVSAANGVANPAVDPFAIGVFFESDYQVGQTGYYANTTGVSTSAGTNLTLTDSGKAWNTNQWINWVLYNSTTGGRGIITANTATQITATMFASDGVTPVNNNASGDTYTVYVRQPEAYFELYQYLGVGATRRLRPIYYTFDRSTPGAQNTLATDAALVIVSATAANPPVFTITGGHQMQAGTFNYVKFGNNGGPGQTNLTGGTWGTNLNGKQYLATVISATTFSVPVNATGYGSYTGNSGTCAVEAGINGASLMVDPVNGLQFILPSWNSTPSDLVMKIAPSLTVIQGRNGENSNTVALSLYPDAAQNVAISGGFHGVQTTFQLATNDPNVYNLVLKTSNQSGANLLTTQVWGPLGSDTATRGGGVGSNSYNDFKGVWNITNFGQTASFPMLYFRPAASQTGDIIQVFDASTGNTSKLFLLDANYNFVPYGGGLTAPATTDTNGFQYVAKVAGAPTGVPANLTGAYANAVPMRYDTTNHKIWFYDGAWKGVVVA